MIGSVRMHISINRPVRVSKRASDEEQRIKNLVLSIMRQALSMTHAAWHTKICAPSMAYGVLINKGYALGSITSVQH